MIAVVTVSPILFITHLHCAWALSGKNKLRFGLFRWLQAQSANRKFTERSSRRENRCSSGGSAAPQGHGKKRVLFTPASRQASPVALQSIPFSPIGKELVEFLPCDLRRR